MVRMAVMQRPEAMLDVTISLWERLAAKLISIIGEGGFQALYSRSIHLTSVTFPWIALGDQPQAGDSRFSGLKTRLEGQDLAHAGEASITLMVTFIDTLALLIGELLTTSILRSAWGDDAVVMAEKELRQ
jgi:hypothetical protein